MSQDRNDSNLGTFVTGFILGGLIGAAAGLILAPRSGEAMRETMVERGIELKDRAGDQLHGARHRAEDLAATARDEVRRRAEDLQQQARDKLERGGEA